MMSNLKHQTPEELRATIAWCVRVRAGHENSWKAKEAEAERLRAEAAEHRKTWHNIGQKEVWARLYLARSDEPAD